MKNCSTENSPSSLCGWHPQYGSLFISPIQQLNYPEQASFNNLRNEDRKSFPKISIDIICLDVSLCIPSLWSEYSHPDPNTQILKLSLHTDFNVFWLYLNSILSTDINKELIKYIQLEFLIRVERNINDCR